jgi:hypothetical protein
MIDMENATLQEAVDYSVQKIVEQGGMCIIKNTTTCCYGNSNNTAHCAVGWLLDESHPMLMSYKGSLPYLLQDCKGIVPVLLEKHVQCFSLLQKFHDSHRRIDRRHHASLIREHGVDTSGEWFNQWINMGEI